MYIYSVMRDQTNKNEDKKMKIKVGKYEYEITKDDLFLDNGACVQLMTQTEEYNWGRPVAPTLSKRAVKEIDQYNRIQKDHRYGDGVTLFSLDM